MTKINILTNTIPGELEYEIVKKFFKSKFNQDSIIPRSVRKEKYQVYDQKYLKLNTVVTCLNLPNLCYDKISEYSTENTYSICIQKHEDRYTAIAISSEGKVKGELYKKILTAEEMELSFSLLFDQLKEAIQKNRNPQPVD